MVDNQDQKNLPLKVGMQSKTLYFDDLTRVEGQGKLHIKVKDKKIQQLQLQIFEPPRFFEALLLGRDFNEAADITARICGICPVAYQITAVKAMESALNITPSLTTLQLRRLLYLAEWIQSHTIHVYMLHAPDILGLDDAIAMAKKDPAHLKRGLAIKQAGSAILQLLGGREVHPINVRVGSFYALPSREKLQELLLEMERGLALSEESLEWLSSLSFPTMQRDYNFVSLRGKDHYPIEEGMITTSWGESFDGKDFSCHFQEYQEPHSTALFSKTCDGKVYAVGPMARFTLNFDLLPKYIHNLCERYKIDMRLDNPYKSILIRSIEITFAFYDAMRLIKEVLQEDYHNVLPPISLHASQGFSVTEAPRGMLYQSYTLDSQGAITHASIIPPTSQNQKAIEEDVRAFAASNLHLDDAMLRQGCERVIRNFDPCISCAAHFLEMERFND